MLAYCPTVGVIDEKDICQVIATSVRQPSPRQTTIICSYYQTVRACSPAQRLINEITCVQPRTRADVHGQPDVSSITSGQHHAAFSGGPTMKLIDEINRIEISSY